MTVPLGDDVPKGDQKLIRSGAFHKPAEINDHSLASSTRQQQPVPLPDGACAEEEVTPIFPVLLERDKPSTDFIDDSIIGSLRTTLVRRTTFRGGVVADVGGVVRIVFDDSKRKPRTIEVPYDVLRIAVASICTAVMQSRPQRQRNTTTSISFPLTKKLVLWLRSPGEGFLSGADFMVVFLAGDLQYRVTTPHNLFRTYLAIFHGPQMPLVENPNKFLNVVNRLM